jgi:hypothetical protein
MIVILSSCSIPGTAATDRGSTTLVTIEDDRFEPFVEYQSDVITHRDSGLLATTTSWLLIGRRDRKSTKTSFYVQWSQHYIAEQWRAFQEARGEDSSSLQIRQVNHNVSDCDAINGCIYEETYNIIIPDDILKGAVVSGYSVKLFSRTANNATLRIPPEMIRALLVRMAA